MSTCQDSWMRLIRLARISISKGGSRDESLVPSDFERLATEDNCGLNTLIPLIVSNVRHLDGWKDIDIETRHLLEARRLQHIRAASRQRQLLKEQTRCLNDAGIPVVLLKGSAFAGYLYSAHTPRSAGDIDLLVHPANFWRASNLIVSQGFLQRKMPSRRLSLAIGYERFLYSPGTDSQIIEIHRALGHRIIFPVNVPSLFQESAPHPDFENSEVRILSVEDNLIHLAMHSFQHLTLASHGLIDAHELICQKEPNWRRLYEKAASYEAKTALFCLLHIIQKNLDTPVPADFLQSLLPPFWLKKVTDAIYRVHPGQGTRLFRVIQLLGQMAVPDSKLRVFTFQQLYVMLRGVDLLAELLWPKDRD